MKVDTLLKAGSLAFDVSQDEKIRELAKLVHHGARRRGLWPTVTTAMPGATSQASKIATAATSTAKTTATAPKLAGASGRKRLPFEIDVSQGVPWQTGGSLLGVPVGKFLTSGNTKRVGKYARELARLLIR